MIRTEPHEPLSRRALRRPRRGGVDRSPAREAVDASGRAKPAAKGISQALIAALLVTLIAPTELLAHRLDEYLQAARVSLMRGSISIEIDLTPGTSIASGIITLLDRDRDGRISPQEAQAYGQDVLSDLVVEFDDAAVPVTLTRIEVPSLGEMRDGQGAIRLEAVSQVGAFRAGRHQVHLRNNHAPASSVYLVNALVPDDRNIGVVAQRRDPQQQDVRIEYDVRSRWVVQIVSIMLAAAGCGVLLWLRWSQPAVDLSTKNAG